MEKLISEIETVIARAKAEHLECVLIEVVANPAQWAQVTWEVINLSYPLRSEPEKNLQTMNVLPPFGARLVDWRPLEFATWEYASEDASGIAAFVLRYCRTVFGVEPSPRTLRIGRNPF